MKINKEYLALAALIVAISPFIIIYKIVKGIYDCFPHKIAERKKMNEEIRTLEKMNKTKSPEKNRAIDEYYYVGHHNGNRGEYFHELREEDYTMPDIIIAAEQTFTRHYYDQRYDISSEFNVLLLVNNDVYDYQEEEEDIFSGCDAKTYLEVRKSFAHGSSAEWYWYFYTLQECPDYTKYYVINTGLKIRFNKILDSEEVKKYIEEFRKNNPKKER